MHQPAQQTSAEKGIYCKSAWQLIESMRTSNCPHFRADFAKLQSTRGKKATDPLMEPLCQSDDIIVGL